MQTLGVIGSSTDFKLCSSMTRKYSGDYFYPPREVADWKKSVVRPRYEGDKASCIVRGGVESYILLILRCFERKILYIF